MILYIYLIGVVISIIIRLLITWQFADIDIRELIVSICIGAFSWASILLYICIGIEIAITKKHLLDIVIFKKRK